MERAKLAPEIPRISESADGVIRAAASVIAPKIPQKFFGKATVVFKRGRPVRVIREESFVVDEATADSLAPVAGEKFHGKAVVIFQDGQPQAIVKEAHFECGE